MSKYQKLNEQIMRHWGELEYSGRNLTSVLIAFETAAKLPVVVAKTRLEFNKTWGDQMEEAKNHLREIHKEVMGFEPWAVLEMVRRIHEFRCANVRLATDPYGGNLPYISAEKAGADFKEKGKFPDEMIHSGIVLAQRALSTKRPAIIGSGEVIEGYELTRLRKAIADEADYLAAEGNGGDKMKTSLQMECEQDLIEAAGMYYIEIINTANSLNFKKPTPDIVRCITKGIYEQIDVPEDYYDRMDKALIGLVEV